MKDQGRYSDQTPIEVRTPALTAKNEVQQYPIEVNKRIEKYYQSFKTEQLNIATAIEKDDLSYDKSSITNFIYFTCLLDRRQIIFNILHFSLEYAFRGFFECSLLFDGESFQ